MKYKVNMSLVRKHCNMPPYIKLLQSEIRQGDGFVQVNRTKGDQSGVYAAGTFNHFLGLVWVPTAALKEAP